MTRYETSPEVRPLEKTICEFAGLNGYDPMNVFTDFLRYVIHGFSPGAPPLKDWRYKRQQNAAFMKMFAEWVRLMQKQLEAASWYDALGDLFMALSSRKGQQAQGQFFTPVHICDLMVMCTETDEKKTGQRINDPTCGSGRLLLAYHGKYSINSLVYWVTYVHNVVYSFYRSMIYCYINSTQRCAGSIVIDIIPTNGADKRKFFPFAPYFPVTNVIKRYFYPYFPAIIGIKGYSFPYFPYLSGIMKIKTALYSLFSRLDWHKTVVFPCLGEIYEGIRSLSWEIPVT